MKKLILLIFILSLFFCPYHVEARAVVAETSADATPPTLSTVTIGTNGTSWTYVYNETVVCSPTSDCCDAFAVTMSTAGAITQTYASGSGSNTVVCTGDVTVLSGETVTAGLDYTQPGNGIEDSAGNDLASIDDKAVTNNSTQVGGGPDLWYFGNATASSDPISESVYTATQSMAPTYFCGDDIVVVNSGQITKLAAKFNNETSAKGIKISLWHDVGGTWTLHECITSTIPVADGWSTWTLSTPYTVGSNETVRVFYMSDGTSGLWMYDRGGTGGFWKDYTYANGCTYPSPGPAADVEFAVAVYVD